MMQTTAYVKHLQQESVGASNMSDPPPSKGERRQLGSAKTLSAHAVENTVIQLFKGGGSLTHVRRGEHLDKVNEIVRDPTA